MDRETQRRAVCCELVHDVARTQGMVHLKVAGASMLPAVWPGDVITVRHCDFAELQPGQIALFRRDGKLTAHRIKQVEGESLITRGDSLSWFDPAVRASEIVGRVVSISRAGRPIQTEQTLWQRAASSMLRRSDFLMRITLCVSRRLRPGWHMPSPAIEIP